MEVVNTISRTPVLFEDIIIAEILPRLPVKSLLKFRCVSKSWRSIISNQQFIKTHLLKSTNNTNFSHHATISTFWQPQYGSIKLCSLTSLLYEHTTNAVAVDPIYPMSDVSARVVGCCNGLCCLLIDGRDFFIWNPSTRKCKRLPPIDGMVKCGFHVTKYGFGLDGLGLGGDYKVFGVVSVFLVEGRRYESIVKIYSFKSDSWKRIEGFKDCAPFDGAGKFATGKLHWARRVGDYSRLDIVSFDLGTEEGYEVVKQPMESGRFNQSFGVVDGCLCVVYGYPQVRTDIWILKGKEDSWDKLVTIPYLGQLWSLPFAKPAPLCIAVGSEILFVCGSTFLVYDPKNNNLIRHPQITNFDEFFETDFYVESLVSPFADGEPEEQNQGQQHEIQ